MPRRDLIFFANRKGDDGDGVREGKIPVVWFEERGLCRWCVGLWRFCGRERGGGFVSLYSLRYVKVGVD